jgi:hypothetical protein
MTIAEQISAEEALANTLTQYAGQWVAVCNHEVIEAALTLEELESLLEQSEEDTSEVEVFEVAEDPHAACFF